MRATSSASGMTRAMVDVRDTGGRARPSPVPSRRGELPSCRKRGTTGGLLKVDASLRDVDAERIVILTQGPLPELADALLGRCETRTHVSLARCRIVHAGVEGYVAFTNRGSANIDICALV